MVRQSFSSSHAILALFEQAFGSVDLLNTARRELLAVKQG